MRKNSLNAAIGAPSSGWSNRRSSGRTRVKYRSSMSARCGDRLTGASSATPSAGRWRAASSTVWPPIEWPKRTTGASGAAASMSRPQRAPSIQLVYGGACSGVTPWAGYVEREAAGFVAVAAVGMAATR